MYNLDLKPATLLTFTDLLNSENKLLNLKQVKLWFYKLPAAWGRNFGCKAKEQQRVSRKQKYQFPKKSKKLAKTSKF